MSRYRAPAQLRRGSLAEQVLILVAHLGPCTLEEVAGALTSRERVAVREALSRLAGWGWLTAEGDQGCERSGALRRYTATAEGRAALES